MRLRRQDGTARPLQAPGVSSSAVVPDEIRDEHGLDDALPPIDAGALPGSTYGEQAAAYVVRLPARVRERHARHGLLLFRVSAALDDAARARDGRPSLDEEIEARQ